jgi:hypothetical protein
LVINISAVVKGGLLAWRETGLRILIHLLLHRWLSSPLFGLCLLRPQLHWSQLKVGLEQSLQRLQILLAHLETDLLAHKNLHVLLECLVGGLFLRVALAVSEDETLETAGPVELVLDAYGISNQLAQFLVDFNEFEFFFLGQTLELGEDVFLEPVHRPHHLRQQPGLGVLDLLPNQLHHLREIRLDFGQLLSHLGVGPPLVEVVLARRPQGQVDALDVEGSAGGLVLRGVGLDALGTEGQEAVLVHAEVGDQLLLVQHAGQSKRTPPFHFISNAYLNRYR